MGYVALTMHPHGSNISVGCERQLKPHPATQQNQVTFKQHSKIKEAKML